MPDAANSDTSLNLNPKAKDQALAAHEVDLFQRALSAPLQSIPKEFETWLIDRIAVLLPLIPISQVVGFTQFTAQDAPNVLTQQSTTSTSYTDLSTVGPQLTGLPDGQYIIFFGANQFSVGAEPNMSIQVNATAASDDDRVVTGAGTAAHQSRAVIKTLDNAGNNTITVKYKSNSGGSVTFFNRWMFALRIANA